LPWSSLVEKKVVVNGDWVTTYFGENHGLASIRLTPQRIHVLGHWRRKAERPSSMRDIGTLDMRMGYNQTQTANDGAGVISQQGHYRTYQHGNRLIMLARPNTGFMNQKKNEIKSIQCTAALFNFEDPTLTWQIFVDDRKVESLPATAKFGQVITVHDGVGYLAIRPFPTDDLGRDSDITLEPGVAQEPAHHGNTRIQPALLVNAHLCKNDAVIERKKSWANMFLRTFPEQNRYVAMNLLPNYLTYSFREPGGVRIVADGACSMGRWAVKDSREIDIRYHAFGGEYLPKEEDTALASLLFITGAKGKPQVTLNQQDVTGAIKPWKQNGVDGWLVSLTGTFLKDEAITARLAQ